MTLVDTYKMVSAYKLGGNSHGKLTSLAVARTIAVPAGANAVILQAESQNVRVRFDGVDPAAAGVGFLVTAGNDPFAYPVATDMDIRAIQEAASASLQYLFLTK